MTSHCGQCSMCCKILPIEELGKPQMTWCKHFKKDVGCSIYTDRPKPCVDFQCYWLKYVLAGYISSADTELRPNRCHVLSRLSEQGDRAVLTLIVDPSYPHAHEAPAIKRLIENAYKADYLVRVCAPTQTITYDRRL